MKFRLYKRVVENLKTKDVEKSKKNYKRCILIINAIVQIDTKDFNILKKKAHWKTEDK